MTGRRLPALVAALALALAALAPAAHAAGAQAGGKAPAPAAPAAPRAQPPRADIVVDLTTGRVIHQSNADAVIHPASLTKLMTLYLVFAALDGGRVTLDTPVPFSARAAARAPSKLGLPAGSSVRLEDAILALAVRSCNDVATAVAELFAGSEAAFAAAMTAEARRLGLSRTTFTSASGLPDPGNLSTARDLALLSAALMLRYPHHWHYLGVPRWRFGDRVLDNTNQLLGAYPGMTGGKTGYVQASGFNLAAAASRDGRHVLAVVIGGSTAKERNERMAALLDAAFARPPVAASAR